MLLFLHQLTHNMKTYCSQNCYSLVHENYKCRTCNSMNNLSSYCGLTDSKMRASDKDLLVHTPKNQTHPRPSLSASRWSLFGVFGQLSCSLRIESLSISGSQASPKNIEIWKIVIQWKLDLRKPDLRKNLNLRKIVGATDF